MNKRLQNLEAKDRRLAELIEQSRILRNRVGQGSDVRIGEVITTDAGGQTFEVDFQNGEYTEAINQTPTYAKRHPTRVWCCSLEETPPEVGDFVLVWYDGRKWWTGCGGTGGGGTGGSVTRIALTEISTSEPAVDPDEIVFVSRDPLNGVGIVGRKDDFAGNPDERASLYLNSSTAATSATQVQVALTTVQDLAVPSSLSLRLGVRNDVTNQFPFIGDSIASFHTALQTYNFTNDNSLPSNTQYFDFTASLKPLVDANTGILYLQAWCRVEAPLVDDRIQEIQLTFLIT